MENRHTHTHTHREREIQRHCFVILYRHITPYTPFHSFILAPSSTTSEIRIRSYAPPSVFH